jgi:prepilin-type N-terminal cleavage/methylation domain-containing protein
MQKNNKGFTLIELLVVIAIIGVLASVVLASLNSARNKGADAAVKANLANARAQAEIYYDGNNSSYNNVCTAAGGIAAPVAAAGTAAGGTPVCNNNAAGWAASTEMKSTKLIGPSSGTDYWCVDSSGASKLEDAALGSLLACA